MVAFLVYYSFSTQSSKKIGGRKSLMKNAHRETLPIFIANYLEFGIITAIKTGILSVTLHR